MNIRKKNRLFNTIAKKILKYGKYLIIIWILLLLISIPLISRVNSVIGLNENSSASPNSQSQIASNIMNSQFPTTNNSTTLIVVFTGGNVLSNSSKNGIIATSINIENDSKNISFMSGINNFYLSYISIVANISITIQNNSNILKSGVNISSTLFFAIPSTFLSIWISKYHENVSDSQYAANEAVAIFDNKTNNSTLKEGYSFFMNGFTSNWVKSFSNSSTENLTVYQRLNETLNTTVPPFINFVIPKNEKPLLFSIFDNFTISDFNNKTLVNEFVAVYLHSQSSFPYWYISEIVFINKNMSYRTSYNISLKMIESHNPDNFPYPYPAALLNNFVGNGNNTMIMPIDFSVGSSYTINGVNPINLDLITIRKIISNSDNKTLSVYVTGDVALNYDSTSVMNNDLSIIVPITIIMIVLVTALYFRSPITPLVTLLGIGIAIGLGYAVTFLVGTYIATVDFTVPTTLLAVLMGVGTDYSVFIVSRYREELTKTSDRNMAMETSLTWAGESIAISGSTVIVAFGALSVTNLTFLKTMGIIIGVSVFLALMLSLTFTPNLILLLDKYAFWPLTGKRWNKYASHYRGRTFKKTGYFYNAGKTAITRGNIIIIVTVIISIFSIYAITIMPTSYNMISVLPSNVNSIKGLNAMSSSFGAGYFLPTYVVITFNATLITNSHYNKTIYNYLYKINAGMTNIYGIKSIYGLTSPNGTLLNYSAISSSAFNSSLSYVGKNRETILFKIILSESPDSNAAISTVNQIKSYLNSVKASYVTGKYVGGSTSSTIDTIRSLNTDFSEMELIVIIGVFVILIIAITSLPIPVFAIISVGITISWALAMSWILFVVLMKDTILWITPIILFILLMGLGMDYNVFILTRIKEESQKGKKLKDAIVSAIGETGGIITAAAVIM